MSEPEVKIDTKIVLEEAFEMDITTDLYVGTLNEDFMDAFTCVLCYGLVFYPVKCKKCEQIYCGNCIPKFRKHAGKFMCFTKCGSKNCIPLGR